jgi:hypothetical protein
MICFVSYFILPYVFVTSPRTALGPTQPPIQCLPGALSLCVKRPEREADYSPPSSAEVENAWSYTSTPQYVFMAWCLVKHRDNFTLFYSTNRMLQVPEQFYSLLSSPTTQYKHLRNTQENVCKTGPWWTLHSLKFIATNEKSSRCCFSAVSFQKSLIFL